MDENKSTNIVPAPVSQPSITPTPVSTTVGKFPSFVSLYKEAWHLLLAKFGSLIKLFFLSLLSILIVVGIIGLFVLLGSMSIPVLGDWSILLVLGALVLIVFYVVSIVYISALSQITYVKILTSENKLPLWKTAMESKPLIYPYFKTLLLSQLVILGGIFFFFIPGILFAGFFIFVTFIIVLENLTGKAALQRSYQLVKPHLLKILATFALVIIPLQIVSQILAGVAENDNPWVYILALPFSIVTSLYTQTLIVVLYKRIKTMTPLSTPVHMKWVWVIAIIGGVLMALAFISFFAYAVMNPTLLESIPVSES